MDEPITLPRPRPGRRAEVRAHLVLPGLEAALAELLAAHALMAAQAALIARQPDLALPPSLPAVAADQARLRAQLRLHGAEGGLRGDLIGVFEAVTALARSLDVAFSGLMPLARVLDTAPPASAAYVEALDALREAIQTLERRATSLAPESRSAALPVAACAASLEALLAGPVAEAAARLGAARHQAAARGAVESLDLQIAALQGRIGAINAAIAAEAAAQVVPALAFGFRLGAAATAETASGTLVLNTGFALAAGEASGSPFVRDIRAHGDDLDDVLAQYRCLLESRGAAGQAVAALLGVTGQGAALADAVARAARSARQVLGQLQLLQSGITCLAMIDEPPVEGCFTAQLAAGIAAWKALATAAAHQRQLALTLDAG